MKTTDIILKYTNGEKNLEETNAALKEAEAGFHLDPKKNWLSPDEIVNGTAGLLFTGTGYPDKVKIVDGDLEYEVNQLNEDGTTNMRATVMLQGKVFEVFEKKLVEVR